MNRWLLIAPGDAIYARGGRFDVPAPSCTATSRPDGAQGGRFDVPEPVLEVK